MDWTKFANGLKGIDRIECDVIPVNGEFAIQVATPFFAIALTGFQHGVLPKQLCQIARSCNEGNAKKPFEVQNNVKRPYALSRTCLTYDPGDKDRAFYVFEGTHEIFGERKPFFIKKRYIDLIPGDLTVLAAPVESSCAGGILFISTQSYGYIMPHKPNNTDWANLMNAATLLKVGV